MINIVGWMPPSSYAPELFALSEYINSKHDMSFTVMDRFESGLDVSAFDLSYMKMGFAPVWAKASVPEIHDYASAAFGSAADIKHWIKKTFSRKPMLRSFLSPYVRARFRFRDGVPFVLRDMGVPDSFLTCNKNPGTIEFDLLYAGSITASRGTGVMLRSIARSQRRVLVVGIPPDEIYQDFKDSTFVEFAGKVKHHEVPSLASKCFAGINYTPDVAPFNRQTSTKVLEYLAMGLPVVSNQYQWIDEFETSTGARFLKYGNLGEAMQLLYSFDYAIPDMTPYRWSTIFEQSGIYAAIGTAYRGSM